MSTEADALAAIAALMAHHGVAADAFDGRPDIGI